MDQRELESIAQSGFQNDDLDRKTPRARLDLEHLEKEVEATLAQLGAVEQQLQTVRAVSVGEVDSYLRKALGGYGTIEELRGIVGRAASGALIGDVLQRCQAARNNLETYRQRRKTELNNGEVAANLKGQVRQLRAEAGRYKSSADSARAQLDTEGSRLDPRMRERLTNDAVAYNQRAQNLAGWEAQLVSADEYQPISEAAFLQSIVISALTGNRHGS